MDFSILLLITVLAGIMGWYMLFYVNVVYWICKWKEGEDTDYGKDVFEIVAVPFAWVFSLLEIHLIYFSSDDLKKLE